MKIAFLSFYSGEIDRGVEVATAALADCLSTSHKVTVFQSGTRSVQKAKTVRIFTKNNWPEDTSNSVLRRFYLDYYSRKIAQFTLKFLPHFLKERYDVVIPTNNGWQVVICRLITWLFRKKMIVQGNAGIGRDDYVSLLTFPDHFIAISPQGLEWAEKKAPWISKSYIPYGVDLAIFQNAKPISVKLKKPIVLCVSAFVPFKRIDRLIRAMKYVSQASLLLVGQGIEKENLQRLGKKLLQDRFLLQTGITHDILPQYYKAADVFSLPSKSSEALGIVYIEAMAAGLPIVATDDKNRREIIGDAGMFVNPENEKKYAGAITKALKKDFGNKPKSRAESFSWNKIVKQYKQLLTSL